jgi:hypothetical protein
MYAYLLAGLMATGIVPPEYNHNSIDQAQKTLIADSLDGGWAVPSLDTAISIGRDVVNREILNKIACKGCRSTDNSNQNSSPQVKRMSEKSKLC